MEKYIQDYTEFEKIKEKYLQINVILDHQRLWWRRSLFSYFKNIKCQIINIHMANFIRIGFSSERATDRRR